MLLRIAASAVLVAALALPVRAEEDPVVGSVNGTEIRQSDIVQAYNALPPEYQQVPVDRLHRVLLDRAIDDVLIRKRADAEGFADNKALQKQIDQAVAQVYREFYFGEIIEDEVSEEAMRARYDEMVKDMEPAEEIHARHILLETEDEAKAVLAEAKKEGTDFAELAKEKSTGPSAPQGGDLGYFTKDRMVPEFAEAAFALEAGEISQEPVKTQFGWHVIKVEDRREAAPPSFEEMKEQIFNDMSQVAIAEAIVDLREGAEIERREFDGSEWEDPSKSEAKPDADTDAKE